MKSPLFSAPEDLNDAKIGLKVMKENSPILPLETKLDDSFSSAQLMLKNYGIPSSLFRNSNGGGLLLYVHEDIPSKFLKVKSDCYIKSIYVDVNFRKRKWFINGSYNPNKSFISNHPECLNECHR